MIEYRQCECPYHDAFDAKQDIDLPDDCPNEGRIRTARYGWLCAECYDQLESAWSYWLEHDDELVVVGPEDNPIA